MKKIIALAAQTTRASGGRNLQLAGLRGLVRKRRFKNPFKLGQSARRMGINAPAKLGIFMRRNKALRNRSALLRFTQGAGVALGPKALGEFALACIQSYWPGYLAPLAKKWKVVKPKDLADFARGAEITHAEHLGIFAALALGDDHPVALAHFARHATESYLPQSYLGHFALGAGLNRNVSSLADFIRAVGSYIPTGPWDSKLPWVWSEKIISPDQVKTVALWAEVKDPFWLGRLIRLVGYDRASLTEAEFSKELLNDQFKRGLGEEC